MAHKEPAASSSWLDTLEQIHSRDFSKASAAEREHAARQVINLASYACAVTAVVPLPFSDAVLMLPIQSAMVMAIGHIHGRKIERENAKEILVELAAVGGASFMARQGIKALLPVLGAVLTIPAAFAANWAMGRVALEYFKNPGATREQLRTVFDQAKKEGGKVFSREKFTKFRREADAAESTGSATGAAKRKSSSRAKGSARRAPKKPAKRSPRSAAR